MTRGSSKLAFWLFAFVSQLKLGPVCAERRQPSARPLQAAAWGHDVAPSASTVILLQVTSRRTSTEGSSMLALLPACVVVAIGAAVVFAVLRPYLKGKESAKIALAAGLVAHHMEGILFTYILTDALTLSKAFDEDAHFSGLLLGVHKMGTASGSFVLWCAMQHNSETWRAGRPIFRSAATLQLIGVTAFTMFSCGMFALPHSTALHFMLLARFITGLGGGMMIFLTLTLFGHMLPTEDRSAWNVTFFLAGVSGLGVGPLLAACVRQANMFLGIPAQHMLSSVLLALPLLPLMQIPSLVFYPSLADVVDESVPLSVSSTQDARLQGVVVLLCVAMQVFRNLSISSLEAGVSLILERELLWSPVAGGIAISAVVSSVITANWLYRALARQMSSYAVQHIMNAFMFLGACVIYCFAPPAILLLGTAVCFAASALSGGLIMATLQRYVLPAGSMLDLNKAMLLAVVGADLLGRGGGPVLARGIVVHRGRGFFAAVQIAMAVIIALLHELASRLAARCDAGGESARDLKKVEQDNISHHNLNSCGSEGPQ
mmetsp:Transcript_35/g.123  ORF Transcript_35/g.123 Transcript_35/m.123 type:complete len:546 (+) Transcript_35:117-1754(+)